MELSRVVLLVVLAILPLWVTALASPAVRVSRSAHAQFEDVEGPRRHGRRHGRPGGFGRGPGNFGGGPGNFGGGPGNFGGGPGFGGVGGGFGASGAAAGSVNFNTPFGDFSESLAFSNSFGAGGGFGG